MNTRFILRTFLSDFAKFELPLELASLKEARQEIRKYFAILGWNVSFSKEKVFLTRGKERRHMFLTSTLISQCDCLSCENHNTNN